MGTERKAVTQEMVNSAAETIVQRGDKPTVEAVRRELGDFGSYSTLTRLLREWRESRKEEVPKHPPPELPEELVTPVLQSLRMTAFRLEEKATERITDIQKEAETKTREISDELRYATSEISRLEGMETENKTVIEQLKNELEKAKLSTAADKERITILEQEKLTEQEKAERATTELTTVKERLQSTEKDKESLQSKLEKSKERVAELTGDLKAATNLSNESTKKHGDLLDKFDAQSGEINELKIVNAKLQTRIEVTNEERDRLAKLLEALGKKENPK